MWPERLEEQNDVPTNSMEVEGWALNSLTGPELFATVQRCFGTKWNKDKMLQEALSHSQTGCFQLSNESISIVEWGEMMPKY